MSTRSRSLYYVEIHKMVFSCLQFIILECEAFAACVIIKSSRKALGLQACEASLSNCKWTQLSESRFFCVKLRQTDATCCMQHCWIMLQHVEQGRPNERNIVQHGGQTHARCCVQQCCTNMLHQHVASV